jgi:hypothetical protein
VATLTGSARVAARAIGMSDARSDLVERVVTEDRTPCLTLGVTLHVGPVAECPVGLRLSRDTGGTDLVLTEAEGRAAEAAARKRAEERVAELEKELAARGPR